MYHRKQNRHKTPIMSKRSNKTIITPIKTVFTPYKDNYFISLQQKTKTTL